MFYLHLPTTYLRLGWYVGESTYFYLPAADTFLKKTFPKFFHVMTIFCFANDSRMNVYNIYQFAFTMTVFYIFSNIDVG